MRFVRSFVVLVMTVASADAQVYRLYCTGQSGAAYGSAVAIGRKSGETIFLTAGHCLTGMDQFYVDLPQGRTRVRKVTQASRYDLAALGVRIKARIPRYQPAPLDQTKGDYVIAGFGNGQRIRPRRTTVQSGRYVTEAYPIGEQVYDIYCGSGALQGESGGAIVSRKGHLVGVISATDGRETFATGFRPISYMFAQIGWRVCPPGGCRPSPQYEVPPLKNGPPIDLPPGNIEPEPEQPDESNFDREIVRQIIREELRSAVAEIEPKPGPRGPKGDKGERGPPGPQGPPGEPGESYDPAEIEEIKRRLAEVEGREPQIVEVPGSRDIVIRVVDEDGQEITVPVTVPPDKSKVTIPIERIQ